MQLITEKLCEHDGMFSTLLYLQPRFRNSISGKEFKWIFQLHSFGIFPQVFVHLNNTAWVIIVCVLLQAENARSC